MTISMAHCIGRSGCEGKPSARGLCGSCYARHNYRGTLGNFPTMGERAAQLRAAGNTVLLAKSTTARQSEHSANWRRKRYAERVLIDGTLVHPSSPHGSAHSYISYGCRGPMCAAAQRWIRDTGESQLPDAVMEGREAEDCLMFNDPRYVK